MHGHGVKIGGGVETRKGEWRCKVCKFKNVPIDDTEEESKGEVERCTMCKEPKQVMKEQAPVKTIIPKVPPTKVHVEEAKAPPQLKVTGVQAKPRGQSVAATGAPRIMTLGQLNQDTMAGDLGKPKERRYHKETTIEMLQNIAKNSDKCDKMPHIRGAEDMRKKEFVKNTREPARFNMETFVREYGDVPK